MKRILLTGFEPFQQESINPSWEAVKQLDGQIIGNYEVMARCLPTAFYPAKSQIKSYFHELSPEVVICIGQAGGRPDITLERIAINLIDARIPDNDGESPIDVPVEADSPAAYWTNLPIKAMRSAIQGVGVPCSISYTAGTYVCNSTFYALMHTIEQFGQNCRGGFIHIPFLPEQAVEHAGKASMSLDDMVRGLRAAIAAVDSEEIVQVSAGTLHHEQ
ncbi:pyroglutamyl-peptidase I [Paenibacillus sp. ACRRX]|uniref:pyroglutamyl-peptidase I n=1 Tax=Paenibacillus sp. ACRRX TaxID=2918206 RepID=UPI001EF6149D|nr:pyroglutamyl-peptidase I [Paenibacillus sp. ACRRX]MCG7410260.1 pyroglutamyl-peptidase I [Paenibacillus sp. ACRRX]